MSMSLLRWIAPVLWLLATVSAELGASVVWWNNAATVTRFEPETGQIRTLAPPSPVRAVAPLADGGAWIVHGQRLARLTSKLGVSVEVELMPPARDARMFVVAADSGGVWVAQGTLIRQFDGSGQRITEWHHASPVESFEVSGPRSVWIGDARDIHQFEADGTLRRSMPMLDRAPAMALLVDPAGGYLWAINARFAIQYDVLAGFTERASVALPPATTSAALDATTGWLWLLAGEQLRAFDRDAAPVAAWAVPGGTEAGASALAVDVAAERLWIGDRSGTVAFNLQAMQWIRVTRGDATTAIPGMHFRLGPSIAVREVTAGPPPMIRLQMGASCNGVACPAAPRYLQQLELGATLAGVDVVDWFVVDRDTGTVDLRNAEALMSLANPLRLSASDAYGNRSGVVELDLASLLAGARPPPRLKANALPTARITAPAAGATFIAPATIAIAATASDTDGTIAKVEFYRDAVLLGTDATSPYAFTWTNVPIGTYALTVKAYDNAGGITTSAIISVQVKANVAPTVALTAPANNSSYVAPATISLAASASDRDGTVSKVEFFQGSTKLATVASAPYVFTWSGVAGGTYSLTAKATDDRGAVTTSAAITVKVNKPPVVALSAPADNTVLQTPASVTIAATASDSDGSISKVEFLRNGILLGTDTSSPYSFTWAGIPLGTYVLTARATDNLGATATSVARTLTVTANQAPAVALTLPANNATFIAGVPVTLAANASDPDGNIAKVEFFAFTLAYGDSILGTDTSNPYSISAGLHVGSNALTAVATDNKGAQTTSAVINVTVVANNEPVVVLTSPINGQVFPAATPPDITIAATAADSDGQIVNVQFFYRSWPTLYDPEPVPVLIGTANAPPYQVTWHDVPLNGGICDATSCPPERYEVIAIATDDGGGTGADGASITVVNQSPWAIQITRPGEDDRATFVAPATIVLSLVTTARPIAGDPVVKVEFIADGNVIGTVVGAPNGGDGDYVHVWRNLGAGTRQITARLYDTAGFVVDSVPVVIRVRDRAQSPRVSVTAPSNGKSLLPQLSGIPADTFITAVADDPDGTVTQVEIIIDDAVLSRAAGSTLTSHWEEIAPGVHVISAAATDNDSARTSAKPVYIHSLPRPRLQAVVLTSPAPGTVTVPFVLEAEVGAPEGGVENVDFYDGATLLGTVTAPPYRLLIASGNGPRTFMAVARLYSRHIASSTPVTVAVSGSNTRPTVSLTAPLQGQVFNVGAAVALSANASDADGSVAKVEFFVYTTLVATATKAPFAGIWIPGAAGTYSLTAKATDNQFGTGLSSAVNVTVIDNTPPQVSITAPAGGQTYFAGIPFVVSANATDVGGAIARVEFFAGSTLIGTTTSAPFTINWSAPAAGSYVLTARATDNSNAVTTSAAVNVTIAANAIPTVTLTMPRAGQSFVTGSTINLAAAANDSDGPLVRVEFYAGATLLASVATMPYTYAWPTAASGNYILTAKAVDTRGAITLGAPVPISVRPLTLSVTSPAPNASVAADFVVISGTFIAPENSGVTVNGAVAATDGQGKFAFNNLPLEPGSNAVEVVLTTLSGQSTSQTLAITSTGDAPFQVVVDPSEGMAPLQTKLRYSERAGSVVSFRVDNLGSGTMDTSQFGPGLLGVLNFASPGIYQPQITIVHATGLTYTHTLSVVVRDPAVVDQGFLSMLSDFTTALKHGNKVLALQHLSGPLRDRMEPVVEALSSRMPAIIDTFKGFGAISIDEDIATYAVKRQSGGKTSIFLFDFLRDFDGVWRLDSM